MSILGTGQRAHVCIFLSSTIPPNDMVCPKSTTTPNHGHIYTYNIYKCVCLTVMNMKYLLRTSCTGCIQIFNDIQQVHTGYKREVHSFHVTKPWIYFQENQKCAYIFWVCIHIWKGEDGMVYGDYLTYELQWYKNDQP